MRLRVIWKKVDRPDECHVGWAEGFDDFTFVVNKEEGKWYGTINIDAISEWGDLIERPPIRERGSMSSLEEAQDWCVDTFSRMLKNWREAMNDD